MRVETRDVETGQLVAARLCLTDLSGAPRKPANVVAHDKGPEHHFVATGGFEIDLPPGVYRLVVERGPEYAPVSANFAVRSGETLGHTTRLKRWIDMNRRGWYSGDLHNHRNVEEMPVLLRAEALNLAPTITDWIARWAVASAKPIVRTRLRSMVVLLAWTWIHGETSSRGKPSSTSGMFRVVKPLPADPRFQGLAVRAHVVNSLNDSGARYWLSRPCGDPGNSLFALSVTTAGTLVPLGCRTSDVSIDRISFVLSTYTMAQIAVRSRFPDWS